MALRLALVVLLVAVLAAPALRRRAEAPGVAAPCPPEGRGEPPRHWLGCEADPGPSRALAGEERLLLGLPLDPNQADERSLSYVPGLSPRLAAALVADRAARGPFRSVDEVVRVRGIGPKRLLRAAPHLAIAAP